MLISDVGDRHMLVADVTVLVRDAVFCEMLVGSVSTALLVLLSSQYKLQYSLLRQTLGFEKILGLRIQA